MVQCPMKFASPSDTNVGSSACEEAGCAWWYDGRGCAVLLIASRLDEIDTSLSLLEQTIEMKE